MSEIAPEKAIQRLEQRHEQLIDELDALNERLEQALNSFVKPEGEPSAPTAVQLPTLGITDVGQDAPTC